MPRSIGANVPRRRRIGYTSTIARWRRSRPGDLAAYLSAHWDLTPDLSIYIEAVHRLSDFGAVVTHAAHGTSQEGFDAEWRMIELSDSRRRSDQSPRDLRRGRPRRRTREVRRTHASSTQAGKRGKPSVRALLGVLRGGRLGRRNGTLGRRHFQRRSSAHRGRRDPTRSGCRHRRRAGGRRSRAHERDVDRHCDPWGAPGPWPRRFDSGVTPRRSTSMRYT